jgi:hypothetical protein
LRELSNIGFMGYQDDGQALIVEFLKNPHDLNRGATVEIPRGFVGEKDRGPVHQRARNRHALLLAAGKLGREVLDAVSEADQVQGFPRPLFSFLFADLGIERGEFDILQRRRACQQVETLKYKADFLVADCSQLLLTQARNLDAAEQVTPCAGLVETAQNIHERRFSTAARAHDGDKLPARDGSTHAPQSMDSRLPQIVVLMDFFHYDHGGSILAENGIAIDLWADGHKNRNRRLAAAWGVHSRPPSLVGAHGASDQFVALLEFALEDLRCLRDRVIGNAGANPYRFEG